MEKRILGVVLSIAGITGLIAAGFIFMNKNNDNTAFKEIAIYGILGAIFFIAGIGLIKSTKDMPT